MLERYLPSQFWEFLSKPDEMNDSTIDISVDVPQNQYPNYAVMPQYEPHGERAQLYPIYWIFTGMSIGLMSGLVIGGSYGRYKYGREGYRGIKLIDKMTSPILKSVLICVLIGAAVGAKGMQLGPNQDSSQLKSN